MSFIRGNFKKTAMVLAVAALPALSTTAAADSNEERIAQLEKQIAELKSLIMAQGDQIKVTTERLDTDEKTIAATKVTADEAHSTRGGTKLSYGGFIKVDTMFTNYSEGKPGNHLIEDFMVPSLIPTSDGSGDSYTSSSMHAKTSRLFFKTATDTDAGKVSTHIEMDFAIGGQGDERISNSFANRLRHAYVKWDYAPGSSILAGQSWSTFFNVAALPANNDFVGPVGTIFNRQPMIRWTTGSWQFAAENPRTRLNGVGHDDFSEGFPDLVARYNGKAGDLNWSLAGVARELTYDTGSADDSTYGYALSLSGKYNMGADDIRFMFNYGDALGRYMGLNAFNDGYIAADGSVETIDQMGGFVAYRHSFNDKWAGGFTLSMAEADNPTISEYASAATLAKSYQTGHLNLIYSPTSRLSFGGELVYGTKELENGNDGDMTRLLMSVKYGI